MKNFTKTILFVVCFVSFKAEAALPLVFAMGRATFTAGRFALTHGVPAAKTAFQAARPHILKARAFAKANPREALVVGGALFGGYNAKEGIIHTTIGAGLGAAAFLFPWSRMLNAKQALALADAKCAIGSLVPKVADLRTKLSATQQGYAAALAKLKNAASPAANVGLGMKNIPVNPSMIDQVKTLWQLGAWKKPTLPSGSALNALVGAAA